MVLLIVPFRKFIKGDDYKFLLFPCPIQSTFCVWLAAVQGCLKVRNKLA